MNFGSKLGGKKRFLCWFVDAKIYRHQMQTFMLDHFFETVLQERCGALQLAADTFQNIMCSTIFITRKSPEHQDKLSPSACA